MEPILITGASGNVGLEVTSSLRAAGAELRLAHRHTGGNPEAIRFDFTDPTSWGAAFDEVEVMLVVRPPAVGNVKRDLLPSLQAAQDAGVQHVVFLSVQGAEKNKLVPHAAVEAWLRTSSMSWTFVRPSFFQQNLSTVHASDIRERDEIVVPAGGGKTAFVDTADVGAVAAQALLHPDRHAGASWEVTGPQALTYQEVADILSTELGRPIRYTSPGIWRYARHARRALGMPPAMIAVTTAIYSTARLGLAGRLTDDVQTVLGRDPIGFAEFAHRARSAWIRP